ncbi:hypothetical protein [Erythrobacter sp. CCH5-A1]|jgi:hypothetical protein|uniref:hypothetical protein n=1 Tax=Erythrobacter sp. CCH5-A1 TaxID=1768792 RepID=UPI00082A9705|nr:hypothetical protein [Erythrobacter sp. CCH5-A1]
MILAATLLTALQAAPAPLAAPEGEIVVTLERLRRVTVNVVRDPQGRWHCGLAGSTGQARLDDRLCRAVTKCVRKGADSRAKVDACIRTSRAGLARELERALQKDRLS